MEPTASGTTYSTYHVEIPSDSAFVNPDDNELWVTAEFNGADLTVFGYQNLYGITNLAGIDPLAAFFKCTDIPVNTDCPLN